jgi:hypothetical protein
LGLNNLNDSGLSLVDEDASGLSLEELREEEMIDHVLKRELEVNPRAEDNQALRDRIDLALYGRKALHRGATTDADSERSFAKLKGMIAKAAELIGVKVSDLSQDDVRAKAVAAYNAYAGGVLPLVDGLTEDQFVPEAIKIPAQASAAAQIEFLQDTARGERLVLLSGGGASTRLAVPEEFNELGIAGLTPAILRQLQALGYANAETIPEHVTAQFKELIARAAAGIIESQDDVSFIQRDVLTLWEQIIEMAAANPAAGVTAGDVLHKTQILVTTNPDNNEAVLTQLAALKFPGTIRVIMQPEIGGVTNPDKDGHNEWTEKGKFPEEHTSELQSLA